MAKVPCSSLKISERALSPRSTAVLFLLTENGEGTNTAREGEAVWSRSLLHFSREAGRAPQEWQLLLHLDGLCRISLFMGETLGSLSLLTWM